jgi:hypothetical protein
MTLFRRRKQGRQSRGRIQASKDLVRQRPELGRERDRIFRRRLPLRLVQLGTQLLARLRRSQQRLHERAEARLATRNDRGASGAGAKPEQALCEGGEHVAHGAHWCGEHGHERFVGKIDRADRRRAAEDLAILFLDVDADGGQRRGV